MYNESETIMAYGDNNTLQSDALLNRVAETEQKLNVDIQYSETGSHDFRQYYMLALASNLGDIDLIYRASGNDLWFLAEMGGLLPITDFSDYIDLSDYDKYGSPGVLEAAMHNGIPYSVQPTYWPGIQAMDCFYVAYNMDMFSSLGVPDLHQYYENETWTWDTFKSVLDIADPMAGPENYLFVTNGGFFINILFASNGFDYITIKDGVPSLNLTSNDAVHALEFYKELHVYGDNILLHEDRWDIEPFVDGKAFMCTATAESVTTGSIAYGTDFSYGIMPIPCGPDVEYGQWAQTKTRVYGLSIPVCADTPEVSAHVISEFCEPLEEFGGSKEGLLEYYKNNIFQSEIDLEIFFAPEYFVRYDYDDAGLIDRYCGVIALQIESGTPSELIQKYQGVAESIYEKYMKGNLNNYIIEALDITE